MGYIYVGKIVNTHALKGEVRIISNFEYKDKVFIKDFNLYLDKERKLVVESYRKHKNFDMIKFYNLDSINDVINFKGHNLYIDEEDLILNEDEILYEDLIGMDVYSNNILVGKITDYNMNSSNKLIVVNNKYVPYNKELIVKIDKQSNSIYYKDISIFMEEL